MRLDLQEYPLVAIVEMHVRNIEGTESLDDYIHQGCQERPWQPVGKQQKFRYLKWEC